MRILIFGGDGMLGHKMFQHLQSCGDVYCSIRTSVQDAEHEKIELLQDDHVIENIDVTECMTVTKLLEDLQPDVTVNCMGLIKGFTPLADDHWHSILVNAFFPHQLVRICRRWGGRVITFSSDCVFDGMTGNYSELSAPNSPSLYGKTKHLGELAKYPGVLTLRTSIIGREIQSFKMLLEWFLAQEGKTIQGFCRAKWSGVTTIHLADLVAHIIEQHPDLHGLYHVASPTLSKYVLLCILRETYKLNVEIEHDYRFSMDKVCDRSMVGLRLQSDIGYKPEHLASQAQLLAEDSTPYEKWR